MSGLAGRRIALIGGGGFIGHHLAIRLKELGAEPFVIDSMAVNNYYSLQQEAGCRARADLYLQFIEQRLDRFGQKGILLTLLDARDYRCLSQTLNEIDPDTIVQLAAVAPADRSNKDPYSTFDHSLRTLENALDNARSPKRRVRHFVYFSSSMVYGHFADGVVTEETPCEPIGIYGALKFAGEKMVIAYNQVFGLPYTIVRPSALYGERCISRRVAQVFVEHALAGERIKVQGDGSDRLDFTYVQDLVSGIVNVLACEAAKNQIFNLTYGQSRSIRELADIVAEHFPGLTVEHEHRDRLIPNRGTLCIDKARALIGYQPRFALEDGLRRYIAWYADFMARRSTPSGIGMVGRGRPRVERRPPPRAEPVLAIEGQE